MTNVLVNVKSLFHREISMMIFRTSFYRHFVLERGMLSFAFLSQNVLFGENLVKKISVALTESVKI